MPPDTSPLEANFVDPNAVNDLLEAQQVPPITSLQVGQSVPMPTTLQAGTDLLLVPETVDYYLRNFPEETYDLSERSHLRRFMAVVLGDSGAGYLRKLYLLTRLRQTLQGTHFYDLDKFYGALFGLYRTLGERLIKNPLLDLATPEEWRDEMARDTSYRSRIEQFARALGFGPTPIGMELIAEAVLSVDCDVYEEYVTADRSYQTYGEIEALGTYGDLESNTYSQLEGSELGRTSFANRRQFVVRPKRAITQAEAFDVIRVLSKIKPADALMRIDAEGIALHNPARIRAVSADSEFWEVVQRIVSTSVPNADQIYVTPPADDPVQQPRPPFTDFQGNRWYLNNEIAGVVAYSRKPNDQGGWTEAALVVQREVLGDGSHVDFDPINAVVPNDLLLAAKAVAPGVMTGSPYGGFSSPDEQSTAGLVSDSVPMSNINRWGVINSNGWYGSVSSQVTVTDARTQQVHLDEENQFWISPARSQPDVTEECLEFRMRAGRGLNELSFDVLHFPQKVTIEVYDDDQGRWREVFTHSITDSKPSWVNGEVPKKPSDDSWVPLTAKLDVEHIQRARIKLQRGQGSGPTKTVAYYYAIPDPHASVYTGAYHQEFSSSAELQGYIQNVESWTWATGYISYDGTAAGGPVYIDVWPVGGYTPQTSYGGGSYETPVDYPLGLRNFFMAFTVDNPTTLVQPEYATDRFGSTVEFSVQRERATDLLSVPQGSWRCNPQPVSEAVVSFFVDTREDDGSGQVIDRFYLDPTHAGPRFNLYYSNDEPDAAFTPGSDPLPVGTMLTFGTVTGDAAGVLLSESDPSYIDISNSATQFDSSRAWWFGARVRPRKPSLNANSTVFDFGVAQLRLEAQQVRFMIDNDVNRSVVLGSNYAVDSDLRIVAAYTPTDETHGMLTLVLDQPGSDPVQVDMVVATDSVRPSTLRIGATQSETLDVAALRFNTFILKASALTDDDIDAFLGAPEAYVTGDDTAVSALLRMHPKWITVEYQTGIVGGAGDIYDDVEWVPISREYALQKGYVHVPPTKAKYWKFEFTNLVAEPYETYLPIPQTVKLMPSGRVEYTADVRTTVTSSDVPAPSAPPGTATMLALSPLTDISQNWYANAYRYQRYAWGDSPLWTYYSTVWGSASLRERSYLFGFQQWNVRTQVNGRFTHIEKHHYETVDLPRQSRVAFFVGLKDIRAYRVEYVVEDNTEIYVDHFDDLENVDSSEWAIEENRLGTMNAQAPDGYEVTTISKVFPSTSPVMALQFATQQSPPRQVVYDDDFRDPRLIGYAWDDIDGWQRVGNATLIYNRNDHTVTFSRSAGARPRQTTISHGVIDEPDHATFAQRVGTVFDVDADDGGIQSALTKLSGAGMAHAAVRFTTRTALTSPLVLQIVSEDATQNNVQQVLAEKEISAGKNQRIETYLSYRIGSVADPSLPVRVRLVQRGPSNDAWVLDTLSLFDESIVWEFSVDAGQTWIPAFGIRNNANGVLRFPNPGTNLRWRLRGYRDNLTVSSLQIRPMYAHQLSSRPFGPARGPNLSVFDQSPPVQSDPEYTGWTLPVPHAWFDVAKRYPRLPVEGSLVQNEFSRLYSRPVAENIEPVTVEMTTQATIIRNLTESVGVDDSLPVRAGGGSVFSRPVSEAIGEPTVTVAARVVKPVSGLVREVVDEPDSSAP